MSLSSWGTVSSVKAFKIFSRIFLVVGVIVFSLKPSMTNRVEASFIHPHHVAFSQFASITQRKPLTPLSGPFCRSAFQKNEDKRHLVVLSTHVPTVEKVLFHAPAVALTTVGTFQRVTLIPAATVVLRI
jgi:hypothetical protein